MILTDSGFWIALGDKSDTSHSAAHAALQRWAPEGLASTWPVITEVAHMLHIRVGFHATLHFMNQVARGVCYLPTHPHNATARMSSLMHRYRDQPMDFARCPCRATRRSAHPLHWPARFRHLSLERQSLVHKSPV